MKYILLMYAEEGAWPPEEHQAAIQEWPSPERALKANYGVMLAAVHKISTGKLREPSPSKLQRVPRLI